MAVEPRWLTFEDVELIHADQLDRYGGAPGTKDENIVQSAIAAPRNLYCYEGEDDLLDLAVELCLKLAKNHGYVDGNKRTATAALIAFLELNGFTLHMPDIEGCEPLAALIELLTADAMTPGNFAAHLHPNIFRL